MRCRSLPVAVAAHQQQDDRSDRPHRFHNFIGSLVRPTETQARPRFRRPQVTACLPCFENRPSARASQSRCQLIVKRITASYERLKNWLADFREVRLWANRKSYGDICPICRFPCQAQDVGLKSNTLAERARARRLARRSIRKARRVSRSAARQSRRT